MNMVSLSPLPPSLHSQEGFPVWEDFLVRGFKLHRQLE